ncbi:13812_t:CDS:2, partial [Ambispora leptoticha]
TVSDQGTHTAQFNLSHRITAFSPPVLQSVNETLQTIPPPEIPMTDIEMRLLTQLNPQHFNVQSPINLKALRILTDTHPNRPFIEYIIKGIRHAFASYIANKLKNSCMCGPFHEDNPPCDFFQTNLCGLVEKKHTNPTAYHIISHLSSPPDNSINDRIDKLEFGTKYENVNHVITLVKWQKISPEARLPKARTLS